MKRRNFLRTAVLGSAGLSLGKILNAGNEKPNILFIFADDQTYESIYSLGYNEVETPNLDRLVKNGVTFTHAYNQGSWRGAVCFPSRNMLNIGSFLWNIKKTANSKKRMRKKVKNGTLWPGYLKNAGYDTYMTGKWHLKVDAKTAFDTARNVRGGMPKQTEEGYNRPVEGMKDPWKPWDKKFGGYWKGGKHWSDIVGDDAVDFLEAASKKESPFFMYIAFNAPHDPRQSPKEYVDKYPLEKIKVPENFLPEYPYKDDIGCGKKLRDEKLAPFPRTRYAVKVNRQEYYAIITHMDTQVGRILDKLKNSGKADNTYIFFTADHGLSVGHHGLFGKQNLFDHSIRVPLMVNGPGVQKNKSISAPVYLQDIMPSTLELAGIEKPDHVQFKSLMPLLKEKRSKNYDSIYGAYKNFQRMVIKDDHKLLLYPDIKKALLFNLKNDPLEMKDLADDPKSKELLKELFAEFLKLQKETGDKLDLREIYSEFS